MPENEVALEATQLRKAYGALQVTRDVSIQLAAGHALGIIGPNGAGKTTLFNLLTGTVKPDAGAIRYFGQDITAVDARRRCHRGISRSFQVPQPFGGMSVYENALVAAAFGRAIPEGQAHDHAADALRRTGLWPKARMRAGEMTLLDRKRLELARSLATGPRLLLLDEIAGGLTEAECRDLVSLILSIKADGVTIIWIEHVMHALLSVVDRIMVLDFGQKIAEGDPETIMRSPEVSSIYLGLDAEAVHA